MNKEQKEAIDNFISHKKVLVAGLGTLGGGVATCRWLLHHKARLTITDLKTRKELKNSLKKLNLPQQKIRLVLGKHRKEDFQSNDIIITNPAMKFNNPYLQAARKKNKIVENEITIFFRFNTNPIIGITGTRGKTTTTNWIAHLLRGKFPQTIRGGNTPDSPVLSFLDKLKPKQPVVLELSCFQLEYLYHYSPHIAVITNLYRDHLDRYKTMENYARTKANIFLSQNKDDYLILNKDNNWTKFFLSLHPQGQVYFTSRHPLPLAKNGLYQKQNKLYFQRNGKQELISNIKQFRRRWGEHNLNNLMQAILAAKLFGLTTRQIRKQIATLPPIPFRQQLIRKEKNLQIINDGASTSPEAVIAALRRFSQVKNSNLILITGGTDKNLDFHLLAQEIKKIIAPNNLILLNGSATKKLILMLKKLSYPLIQQPRESLKDCWKGALQKIKPRKENIIIFSPGGSSFEKFKNEFDRGEQFNKLVKSQKF